MPSPPHFTALHRRPAGRPRLSTAPSWPRPALPPREDTLVTQATQAAWGGTRMGPRERALPRALPPASQDALRAGPHIHPFLPSFLHPLLPASLPPPSQGLQRTFTGQRPQPAPASMRCGGGGIGNSDMVCGQELWGKTERGEGRWGRKPIFKGVVMESLPEEGASEQRPEGHEGMEHVQQAEGTASTKALQQH